MNINYILKFLCLVIIAGCSDASAPNVPSESKIQAIESDAETEALKTFTKQLVEAVVDGDGKWKELIGSAEQFKAAYTMDATDEEPVDQDEIKKLHAMVVEFIPKDCAQVFEQQQDLWQIDWSKYEVSSAELIDETVLAMVSVNKRTVGLAFDGDGDRIGVIDGGKLLLVQEKTDLMQKMGKRELIIFPQKKVESLPSSLSNFNLVIDKSFESIRYTYDKNASRTGITRVLTELAKNSIVIKDLQTHQSTLEEVFLSLINRAKK